MKLTNAEKKQRARKAALRWVKALESGKYKQGRGLLKTDFGYFCCLGVACDVLKEEVKGRWTDDGFTLPRSVARYEPPVAVIRWLQLSSEQERDLIRMNDESGASFKAIASTIRTWYGLPKRQTKRRAVK